MLQIIGWSLLPWYSTVDATKPMVSFNLALNNWPLSIISITLYFPRKGAKATVVLISLLGFVYLLTFYQPEHNKEYQYFVAAIYPFQVHCQ